MINFLHVYRKIFILSTRTRKFGNIKYFMFAMLGYILTFAETMKAKKNVEKYAMYT